MLLTESEHRSLCVTNRDLLTQCAEELWTCRKRYLDKKKDPIPLRNDEEKCLNSLLNNGFEIVGRGSSRIVIRFPKPDDQLVVKLARYGENPTSIGMWQNKNEIHIWSKYESEDVPLAPIYDWKNFDFKWIIMPYGESLVNIDLNPIKFERVKQKVKYASQLAFEELTKPNFISINDTYYLADYGSLERNY